MILILSVQHTAVPDFRVEIFEWAGWQLCKEGAPAAALGWPTRRDDETELNSRQQVQCTM